MPRRGVGWALAWVGGMGRRGVRCDLGWCSTVAAFLPGVWVRARGPFSRSVVQDIRRCGFLHPTPPGGRVGQRAGVTGPAPAGLGADPGSTSIFLNVFRKIAVWNMSQRPPGGPVGEYGRGSRSR